MANPNLSEDTNEIIQRLTREGELLRNKGSHSVRSVKIELQKFEGLFDTIAMNVVEQTEMMRETLGIQQDAARAQERAAELEELKMRNVSSPAIADSQQATQKDGPGVFGIIGNALTGVLGGLGKLAIGGAIGIASAAVLWEVAKGFIDQKLGSGAADKFMGDTIDGIKNFKDNVITRAPKVIGDALDDLDEFREDAKEKWNKYTGVLDDASAEYEKQKEKFLGEDGVLSKVESSVDGIKTTVDELREDIPEMITTAKTTLNEASGLVTNITGVFEEVNFATLKSTFTRLSTELPPAANKILDFFANPLTSILPAVTAGLVTGGVARTTGQAIAGLTLPKGVGPGGTINPVANLRTAAIGAVGLGIAIFGDKVKGWIESDEGLGNVDVAGVNVGSVASGAVDILGAAAQGATIGAMFGPQGALVGAILGGTIGLGTKLWNWFTNNNAKVEAEALAKQKEAERIYNQNREQYDTQAQELATATPAEQAAATAGMTDAQLAALDKGIENTGSAFIEEQQYQIGEYERLRQMGSPAAAAALARVRAVEEEARAEGITIVNYAPTNVQGGTTVGGSSSVQSATVNSVGGGGGTNGGSPFADATN